MRTKAYLLPIWAAFLMFTVSAQSASHPKPAQPHVTHHVNPQPKHVVQHPSPEPAHAAHQAKLERHPGDQSSGGSFATVEPSEGSAFVESSARTRTDKVQQLMPARIPVIPMLVSPKSQKTPHLADPRIPVVPFLAGPREPKIRDSELPEPRGVPLLDELPPPVVERFVMAPTRFPATGKDVRPRLQQPRTIAERSLQPRTPTAHSLKPKTPTERSPQARITAGRVQQPRITVGRE